MEEGLGKEGKKIRGGDVNRGKGAWSKWKLLLCADPLLGSSQHLAVLLVLPFHLCCQGQSLFSPKDLYISRLQTETKAKILTEVMTMANVISYEMFGKTQKGMVVCDMKFKR